MIIIFLQHLLVKDSFQTEAVDEFFHFELIDKQVFDKNNTLVEAMPIKFNMDYKKLSKKLLKIFEEENI